MATKTISAAAPRSSLAATDMLPLAAQGENTAYHITGQALFDSLPGASTSQKGVVELAGAADIAAGTPDLAVDACALRSAMAGTHGLSLGTAPPTLSAIDAAFLAAFGRYAGDGDVVALADTSGGRYLLAYAALGSRRWAGFSLVSGAFVEFS